jgi:hypothetical protein
MVDKMNEMIAANVHWLLILCVFIFIICELCVNKKEPMKNLINNLKFATALVLIMTLILSCSDRSGKNEVLTSKIQYDVPVNNNDPQLDWWINNIEGSRREPFLQRIIEGAQKGDVKVYDYFNNPLTPSQIMAIGSDTIYQTLLRSFPPYDEYDTLIIRSITYRDILKIRFLEEWNWNPETLEIDKKVLAIGPVIQKEIAGESFNQLLFWIYLDKRYPEK